MCCIKRYVFPARFVNHLIWNLFRIALDSFFRWSLCNLYCDYCSSSEISDDLFFLLGYFFNIFWYYYFSPNSLDTALNHIHIFYYSQSIVNIITGIVRTELRDVKLLWQYYIDSNQYINQHCTGVKLSTEPASRQHLITSTSTMFL